MRQINRDNAMQDKPKFSPVYAPLQAYVAGLHPQLWRLALGMVIFAAIYLIGTLGFFFALVPVLGLDPTALATGAGPLEMVVFLASFAFLTLGVVLASLWPARRPLFGLIGPWAAAQRDFWRVLIAMLPLLALSFAMTWAFDPSFAAQKTLGQILPWAALFLAALFIQISAEELAFRGFIMGQLAARFSSPVLWMIVPSVLFGAIHYSQEAYGDAAWIVCVTITVWAVMVSDITARTGNLGAALGLHFANNFMAMLLVGQLGQFDGMSLYTSVFDPANLTMLVLQFAYIGLSWLVARWALKV